MSVNGGEKSGADGKGGCEFGEHGLVDRQKGDKMSVFQAFYIASTRRIGISRRSVAS